MLTCGTIARPKYNRRTLRAWCLYDFGNSAFAVLFPAVMSIYFAKVIVGDEGLGKLRWGQAISLSMLLVAVTSPFLGGIADHANLRKRMLAIYTALGIVAVLCIPLLGAGMVWRGFIVIVLANVAFEGGIVFYNSYLPLIAEPERHGRVSAHGYAVGYVGSLVALGYAAVLTDALSWVWVLLALQWLLFASPGFKYLPRDEKGGMGFLEAGRHGLRTTKQTLRDVWGMTDLRRFLIAYFFYMDGVLTVIHFANLYAIDVLKFSTQGAIMLLGLVQITALAGSWGMAGVTDRRGPKWTVSVTLLWWIGVVVAAYFATSKPFFTVVAGLAGLGLGSIQAASRAFMSQLIPKGRESEMFGFYGLCGKSGAVLGPVMFGLIWEFVGPRQAILSVAAFYVLGYALLRRVGTGGAIGPEKRRQVPGTPTH